MRTLMLLPLLLAFVAAGQNPPGAQDGAPLVVVGSKWTKTRQAGEKIAPEDKTPARAVTRESKNYDRNVKPNQPSWVRDPYADTLEGRAEALEKTVQDARTPTPKSVDGYTYLAKVQNASPKVVEIVFWEYRFVEPSNPASVARRQFLCGVQIKPGKEKELQAFSTFGPADVVSAASPTRGSENAFEGQVIINRVEYTDGAVWQRRDWNASEIRQTYARAVATPWQPQEMCRRL